MLWVPQFVWTSLFDQPVGSGCTLNCWPAFQQDLVEEIRTKQEKGNFRPVEEDGHEKYPSWKVDADTANNKRYHFTLGTPQAGEFSNLVLIIYSWTRCDRPVPTSAAALCLTTLNFQVSPGVFYSKVRSSLWWWWVKNWRSPNLANKSTSMESLNWQWMFWGPVFWSFADEAAIVCWLGGSSCACATGTASSTTTGRTTRVTRRTSSWWDARDRCWGVAGHHRKSWEHLLGKAQMIMKYQMVFRSYWQNFNISKYIYISNIGDCFCMELYHIISNIFPSWLRLSTSWTHFVHVFISA